MSKQFVTCNNPVTDHNTVSLMSTFTLVLGLFYVCKKLVLLIANIDTLTTDIAKKTTAHITYPEYPGPLNVVSDTFTNSINTEPKSQPKRM